MPPVRLVDSHLTPAHQLSQYCSRVLLDSDSAAIRERDFLLVQNLVLIYAFVFMFANLVVDMCYAWIDPRIHYE